MSIRFGVSAAFVAAALLLDCATASAQGRGGPGGRGGMGPTTARGGGGMAQGSGTAVRGQSGCSMGSVTGATSGTTSMSARTTSPAQSQYSQLVANQQMQAWYARYYAEQAEYKVYIENLMRQDAARRAARQLQGSP